MHGRPRKAPQPEEEVESAAKAVELRKLQSQFLENHQKKIYDKEAIELSAKLVEINPEVYTAWNYRKLAVDHSLSQCESDPETVQSILNEELRVVECALRQNPKAYGAWYHRKWILNKGHSSVDHELKLLLKFQKLDARNFHSWNYRRFVAAMKNIPEKDELKYTTDMIERNLSNYSAWHNRSIVLSNLIKRKAEGFFPKEKVLSEEYDLVHQAIFTDPDDQSGWFYHLWLLEQTVNLEAPFLMSSWPFPGSEFRVSACDPSYHPTGMIPVILYFNQAVKLPDSSSVILKSVFTDGKDVVWRPLSANKCQFAQAWCTFVDTSCVKLDPSESYTVEVFVGDQHNIVSFSGLELSHPFQYKFVLGVNSVANRAQEGDMRFISWEQDNFKICSNDIDASAFPSLDQLSSRRFRADGACKWQVDTLANEIELFRELLSESNCKIGKLTLCRLLTALDTITSGDNDPASSHFEEILELYNDLMKLDTPHVEYYKEEHSLTLLRKITSSKDSLLQHCWLYKGCALIEDPDVICIRLNDLELSRIGSVEKFLWVRMLDLSHNKLGNIEGLEALQLLSCLNLSHNRLKSFSALYPIRHLKSLRVLDISHNEIGEHYIDTTRYLFPSPLSHSDPSEVKSDQLVADGINAVKYWEAFVKFKDQLAADGINVVKYWEAFVIFKDLNLQQLDIVGNPIVVENFVVFLTKLMLSLKWLDDAGVHN